MRARCKFWICPQAFASCSRHLSAGKHPEASQVVENFSWQGYQLQAQLFVGRKAVACGQCKSNGTPTQDVGCDLESTVVYKACNGSAPACCQREPHMRTALVPMNLDLHVAAAAHPKILGHRWPIDPLLHAKGTK